MRHLPERLAPRRGQGFTLPELLVSLALIIFIMSIIASAFGAAGKLVSDMRAAYSLAERLRGVMSLLRKDLSQQHLDNTPRRLGTSSWVPVNASNKGFFRILQLGRPTFVPDPAPTIREGVQSTSIMPATAAGSPATGC